MEFIQREIDCPVGERSLLFVKMYFLFAVKHGVLIFDRIRRFEEWHYFLIPIYFLIH